MQLSSVSFTGNGKKAGPENRKKCLMMTGMLLAIMLTASTVFADYIGGKYINPGTNLPGLTDYSFNQFTIDQIADGIVSDAYPYNGFASSYSSGTITLDLVGEFNLTSFFLWNDINVQKEGIKDFRLDFFNNSDVLIDPDFSSVYTAPLGQVAGQEYIFGKVVQGVSRVDLVVLNSQPYTYNRIEIREVGFSGEPTPEPATMLLLSVGIIGLAGLRKKVL